MTLTVGSLFSGIGGLDLGLERAGMKVIWQSEIDPYASRVLAKHWPEVPNYGNIKNIRWGDLVSPDVICGGYPCQPFSTAGKRQGTEDPRHLWPWVREAISELRPKYAILENVRGHITLGLNAVLGDLASIGYDAEWHVISAASVGAPHRRDRVFIVAYPNSSDTPNGRQCETIPSQNTSWGNDRNRSKSNARQISQGTTGQVTTLANANSKQLGQRRVTQHFGQTDRGRHDNTRGQAPDDLGEWWTTEPNVGRVANGVSNRVDRLKGLGNAVVPQVAELVGRMVMEHSRTC
jgi:DNA (cytosine-5)-methyltransferase 1